MAQAQQHGARAAKRWPPALLCASLTAVVLAWASLAAAIDVPALQGPVNDYAGLLSGPERSALEGKLRAYQQKTSQEFTLLTVPTLDGQPIEDFGIKVSDKWKLGDKQRDDYLILIIVSKDRLMRIENGYGLEGDVPDALAARVIREVIAPAFRANQFAQGIDSAFNVLMQAASGEAPPQAAEQPPRRERRKQTAWSVLSPLILPFILFLIFSSFFGGGRRRRRSMFGGAFLGGMGGGGWGGGGWGGGGGGWGGGGGGGGWGGGGGSGGGGGASGSW